MTQNAYQELAALFESMVSEASTTAAVVNSFPGGAAVMKRLHQDYGLSHTQTYQQISKISWNDLKEPQYGTWVLLKCETGTGAIRYNGGQYQAVSANQTNQVQIFSDDRGGNILDFLKRTVGKPVKIFVGQGSNDVQKLQRKRQDLKRGTGTQATEVTPDTIIKKFKPLWVKTLTLAQADIKGMVNTMIKNDAYGKASRKLRSLEEITNSLDAINAGDLEDAPSFIRDAVKTAIEMSASHYYPEDDSEDRYGRNYNQSGQAKVLRDIAGGDTSKLGTVLGFFKRSLVAR